MISSFQLLRIKNILGLRVPLQRGKEKQRYCRREFREEEFVDVGIKEGSFFTLIDI